MAVDNTEGDYQLTELKIELIAAEHELMQRFPQYYETLQALHSVRQSIQEYNHSTPQKNTRELIAKEELLLRKLNETYDNELHEMLEDIHQLQQILIAYQQTLFNNEIIKTNAEDAHVKFTIVEQSVHLTVSIMNSLAQTLAPIPIIGHIFRGLAELFDLRHAVVTTEETTFHRIFRAASNIISVGLIIAAMALLTTPIGLGLATAVYVIKVVRDVVGLHQADKKVNDTKQLVETAHQHLLDAEKAAFDTEPLKTIAKWHHELHASQIKTEQALAEAHVAASPEQIHNLTQDLIDIKKKIAECINEKNNTIRSSYPQLVHLTLKTQRLAKNLQKHDHLYKEKQVEIVFGIVAVIGAALILFGGPLIIAGAGLLLLAGVGTFAYKYREKIGRTIVNLFNGGNQPKSQQGPNEQLKNKHELTQQKTQGVLPEHLPTQHYDTSAHIAEELGNRKITAERMKTKSEALLRREIIAHGVKHYIAKKSIENLRIPVMQTQDKEKNDEQTDDDFVPH